ncbi:hypothetical protein [Myxococcus sp. RHSTA-1-4]|uniref:hypothetical protein n=1 Tax=Myxococcus sp. RHSTA-1-4 TaxID=2874601 RepID=UPI001CC17895|nr:hypothetical protein [Myxococcus sp. RHSTA-1-4]MBZ4417694.1 hypothetical protein [Myxococcus sp. RHSTA-1-4]
MDPRKLMSQRSVRGLYRELRSAFERNPWRDGVVRRSGIPLANLAYDAWYTWRAVRQAPHLRPHAAKCENHWKPDFRR